MATVRHYGPDNQTNLPVSGAGTALVQGALLKRGPTPGTNNGFLILATGTAANPDIIGILQQAHPTADDTTLTGTVFTTRPIDVVFPYRVVRMRYSQVAADRITVTEAVNTTTITLTSLENDIDAAFLYVVAGTGAGQTKYLTASAAGSATLKEAFTTSLDTTSRLIKILPRFHQLASITADGTQLSSQAAAGSVTVMVMDTYIIRDGDEQQFSPVNHSTLTGLNGLASLQFEADVAIVDTAVYQIA